MKETLKDALPRRLLGNSPLSEDIRNAAAGSRFLCSAATETGTKRQFKRQLAMAANRQPEAEAGQTGPLLLGNAFVSRQTHLVSVGGADGQGVANQQSHVVLLHHVNETKRNHDLQE